MTMMTLIADLRPELTAAEYSRVFRLLDKYSRSEHRSFLAELFPSEAEAEYVLCFRPLDAIPGSSDNACLYLRVETAELKSASKPRPSLNHLSKHLQRSCQL